MRSASWVIVNRKTGAAVMETTSPKLVRRINTAKYKAVTALQYMQEINARIKATGQTD